MTDRAEGHRITVRPAAAFDGGDWWRSACSCGKYTSGLWRSPGRAEAAGRDHAKAMNDAAQPAKTTQEMT